MKKALLTLLTVLIALTTTAQQQGINYKALIKDDLGNVLSSAPVSVQFIITDSNTINVYQESHTENTDVNGLIIVSIGEGTTADTFADIDWANDDHFLNVQVNIGAGLVDMGTTQFMAVPYAKHANTAETATIALNAGATSINGLSDGKSDPNGSSLFLGVDAGVNDNGTDNRNVAVGYQALTSNTTGSQNTANGNRVLVSNTTGSRNTANGYLSLLSNTTGTGNQALQSNTTGANNTASGYLSLSDNTTGNQNTASGYLSLSSNTTGNYNVANGSETLRNNTTGTNNAASGYLSLSSNTTGNYNVANGSETLRNNTTGINNAASGYRALYSNTIGTGNTASGNKALYYNIGGEDIFGSTNYGNSNTANGHQALYSNKLGSYNTANGYQALYSSIGSFFNGITGPNGNSNTANGYQALYSNTYGNSNTASGHLSLSDNTTGSNNTGLGYNAQVPSSVGSNQVRIGNSGINYAGIQVAWTVTSDIRWKNQVRNLPFGLNLVSQLRPVDYIRKNNDKQTREIGFIAQEVEKTLETIGYTDQGFLTKDDNGYLSIRYNDLIPILTKAIQEQQAQIEVLKTNSQSQENVLAEVLKRLDSLENTKQTNKKEEISVVADNE